MSESNGPVPKRTMTDFGMRLAVPFNHDPDLIKTVSVFASQIGEIYLPAPLDVVGTFRPWMGPDIGDYRRDLPAIVDEIHRAGFQADMVMNTAYIPVSQHRQIAAYAKEATAFGVDSFTLGDLHQAEAIRSACPDVGIVASTVADIDAVTKARYWVRQAGATRFVLARLLNKRPDKIREIAKVGRPIEIIVNELCIPGCPYAYQHSCTLGGFCETGPDDARVYGQLCRRIRADHPWEHLKTEVLPIDLPRYEGLVQWIKVTGRDCSTHQIMSELARYTAMSSNRHATFGHYLEPEGTFEMVSSCDRYCEGCGWCEREFVAANPDWRRSFTTWRGPTDEG